MENKKTQNPLNQFDGMLLNRLRLKTKLSQAKTQVEADMLEALLYLYNRGDLEISNDPMTGEMLYQIAGHNLYNL